MEYQASTYRQSGQTMSNPLLDEIVRNAAENKLKNTPHSARQTHALKRIREHLVRSGESLNLSAFKDAASHEIFVDNLFNLFDEDGDGFIDQDEFLQPFYQQLTDERGVQFCEVVETATYAIAVEQNITSQVFARIFATKGLLDKLFRLMDVNGDNMVSITEAMDFIAKVTLDQSQTSLTKENIEYLTKLFAENCDSNNEITLNNFRKIIRSKNVFFTERVFHIFDRDGSGTVSMQEFLDAVSKFSGQSMDNKIKFLFDIYDLDSDGRVQMIELRQVMKACMDENGMKFSDEQLDDLTTALFEDADPQNTGAITVEALKAQLEKHEGLLENLSYSIEKWLVPPKPVEKTSCQKLKESKPHQLSWQYIKNNYVFLIFLFLYLAVNVALFGSRVWQYRDSNGWVQFARGCGQCLNFTCTFILVCMLRKSITFLRSLGASVILPLDEHIYFHKLTGWLILIFTIGHTVAHIGNLVVLAHESGEDDPEDVAKFVIKLLFTTASKIGWIGEAAFPTGVALLVILIIMVVCSLPFVRKSGKFEVFYWTHRLYIAFFILCFVHGPRFWHWFIVPGVIFCVEMIIRFIQRRTGYGRTYIEEAVLLPSTVTHLVIKRPPNFHFHPGDYIFIKVPAIAKYEWHPFTLSSAPEQNDVVWLHIRGVGEWTNRLYNHINKQLEKLNEARNATTVNIQGEGSTKRRSFFGRGSRFLRNSPKRGPANDVRLTLSAINQGYESMNQNSMDGGQESGPNETQTADDASVDKKRLSGTKSLPILEDNGKNYLNVNRKGLARTASHQIRSFGPGDFLDGQKVCIRTRSMGQSFRHIRRKPRTLPMPGLSSVVIQEEDETQESSARNSLKEVTNEYEEVSDVGVHPENLGKSEVVTTVTHVAVSTNSPRNVIQPDQIVCYDEASGEKPLEIVIDGPYGAPSSHIFRAEHAVLIGTGIGVTPFASILQSIMRRYWDARLMCPKCNHKWTNELPGSYLSLKKVDFFWINRDQKSFEWFINLLSQLEIEQAEQGGAMERFLDMHMYITSALQKTDMKAVGLHLALDLLHEKEKRDLITGLKTRTQAGRPNWNKVFRQITQQKKGKVTVFFCGPPQMARSLKLKCDEFGFSFKKEIF